MPTNTEQTLSDWDTAALVRGEDVHHNFEHCPQPTADLEPDAVEFHQRAANAMREIIYMGAHSDQRTL